jgi:3-polyprenyl-4-hydroxybenzoate decarboxylase
MSMQVTAITHKRKPVWVSILSEVTPSESSVMKRVAYEPRYLSFLRDTLGIKGVHRVAMHEPLSNLRKILFVQFSAGVPRTEIWRALQGAATLQADIGKYVIGISEDIDPDNPDAVFWSLAYRANPIEDVHIAPYRSPGHGAKSEGHGEESTMLIDATQKEPDPPVSLPKREFMERALTIWQELGLPPVTPRQPWHGYSLGDWNAVWDTYARRAVEGKWEETGKETFAHRRGGLTPETPVKSVKD